MSKNMDVPITWHNIEEKIAWWLASGNRENAERLASSRSNFWAPDGEVRAGWGEYFERLADDLAARGNRADALWCYDLADNYYSRHASEATSGGEGTARMRDVNRLSAKRQRFLAKG